MNDSLIESLAKFPELNVLVDQLQERVRTLERARIDIENKLHYLLSKETGRGEI